MHQMDCYSSNIYIFFQTNMMSTKLITKRKEKEKDHTSNGYKIRWSETRK